MLTNVTVLLYAAATWAFTFIFLKIEEREVLPITVMAGRASVGFLTLFIASLIMRKDLKAYLNKLWMSLIFAILAITVLWTALAFGQEYLTAGLASVMVSVVPLVTFVLLVFILREERFSIVGLIGLILGVAGIVMVIGLNNILGGGSTLFGVLLIAGGFIVFAINGVLIGKWAQGMDPIINTTYFLGLGALLLIALAFIFESPIKFPLTKENILSELALGVICTGTAYFGYFYLIHKAGSYFSSFLFYFIPVFGLLAGHLILKEHVAISQMIGVAVIIIGVYLINREKAKEG